MDKRRSERLRRKRQTTPGVSQPGAYSVYNDGYVVESEASFLPNTTTPISDSAGNTTTINNNVSTSAKKPPLPGQGAASTPRNLQSRRTRYKNSPHRYTVEDSPVIGEKPPASTIATPTDYNASDKPDESSSRPSPGATTRPADTVGAPDVTPEPPAMNAAPRDARPDRDPQDTTRVVDRVRTSLFDILGSATRRPINPHWRAPPSLHPNATARPVNRRVSSSPMNTPLFQDRDDDVVPSDDERDHEENSDDEDDHRQIPAASPLQRARALLAPPSRRQLKRLVCSPVPLLTAVLLFSILILASLHASDNARRNPAVDNNSAWARFSQSIDVSRMSRFASIVRANYAIDTSVNALTYAGRLLFRNAWTAPPSLRNLDERTKATTGKQDAEGIEEMVTRSQLEAEILPRLLEAARSVASEEATRTALNTIASELAAKDFGNGGKMGTGTDDRQDEFPKFLERYAADKDLPADFALGSAGGVVISTQPSVFTLFTRYYRRYAKALISEGVYMPTQARRPSVVLNPDVLPGNCWAFDGSVGSITIRLARPVIVQSLTIEHTPQSSAFSIASAMKRFRVVGMPVDAQEEDVDLGSDLFFDLAGEDKRHLQRFFVDATERIVIRAVRLDVLSNHGADFTAIYRIRVHGDEDLYFGNDGAIIDDELAHRDF